MANICVFCASSERLEQRWLDLAFAVGAEIARRGHTLVSGGGCVGMMGAVTDGARSAGGRTVGIIPQSLLDLEVADRAADELVVTADMADRKTTMVERSDAFLTLPGGLGTLDELFEVWTTATLAQHSKPMALLDTEGFYQPLLGWLSQLTAAGFIRDSGLELLTVAASVPAAIGSLEERIGLTAPRQASPAEPRTTTG